MSPSDPIQPIAVYLVERHPLQRPADGDAFRWIGEGQQFPRDLTQLIGPHTQDQVTVLVDDQPAGPAWQRLLDGLIAGDLNMVVTHLAPLTSAQRQQLIGLCDQTGAQLITPADAGRNRGAR